MACIWGYLGARLSGLAWGPGREGPTSWGQGREAKRRAGAENRALQDPQGAERRCWIKAAAPTGSLPAHSCAGRLGDTGAPVCGEGLHGRKGAQVEVSKVFQAGAWESSLAAWASLARVRGRTGKVVHSLSFLKGLYDREEGAWPLSQEFRDFGFPRELVQGDRSAGTHKKEASLRAGAGRG